MNVVKSQKETVSILLPTRNGEKYIDDAIKSILDQTFMDWKLIVIDDCSHDGTWPKILEWGKKDSRIKTVRNAEHKGIQKSLNIGLALAKGEYIARIDDDDRWVEEKLQLQMEYLNNHHDCVLVGTGAVIVDENNNELMRYLNPNTDQQIRNSLLRKNCFTHSSVLFRKNAAIDCGGYNESGDVLHIEDYDLWLAMGLRGKLANLPLYGIYYMMRSNAIGAKYKRTQFINDIHLIMKYRDSYPAYALALARGYIRFIVYSIFPAPLFGGLNLKFLKYYKELW